MKIRSLSYEDCKIEAKKYKKISHFKCKASKYYSRAYKIGWVSEICDHMKLKKNGMRKVYQLMLKNIQADQNFIKNIH